MKRTLFVVPLMLAGMAIAQEIPKYAVDKDCERIDFKYDCIESEQKNYNDLKKIWGNFPGEVRAKCIAKQEEVVDRRGWKTYQGLKICLDKALAMQPKLAAPPRFHY